MPDAVSPLAEFFARDVCQRATAPLRNGVEIAVKVDGCPDLMLVKTEGRVRVQAGAPARPDMTFHVPPAAIDSLCAETTTDIGEIGVAILRLMASADAALRVRAQVHIGLFDLLRGGYLGVLPLGGATVMKFLASKGLTNIGKIKDGLSRLRERK